MLDRPVFKPHFRVEVVPGEGIFLLSECGHKVLTGRLFQLVAPFVDGERRPDEVADCVAEEVSSAEVYYALSVLEQKGYLMEATTPGPLSAFWTLSGIDPARAEDRLKQLPVSVSTIGDVNGEPFISALQTVGVHVADEGVLKIVLADDYLRADLAACNEEALKSKQPWMLIRPVGIEIFVGPLFSPDKTGCWRCLRDRYILHREAERFIVEKRVRKELAPGPAVHTPATVQIACNMAATEITRWIAAGENPHIEGRMLSLDIQTWQTRSHSFARLTHCPACGKAPAMRSRHSPVVLKRGKAVFTVDGGYRIATPEKTVERFGHLVSPITGIVNFLERDQTLDGPVHVYRAGHNFALKGGDFGFLRKGLRSLSAGKGMSRSQAKASGLCEAIERYSGLFQGYEARITSSLADLGDRAIRPNECMLFSCEQYRNRAEINARKSRVNTVPTPFEDESLEIEWSPVWSLTHETFKYLPTQYLYYRYVHPNGGRQPVYFQACSNGSASGNSLEEAVLQGFFELVERDSMAIWWYNMLKRPAVDLTSFDEPYFAELERYYRNMNREMWVLDMTSDLGIPAFFAISARLGQEQERLIFGAGCHLDAKLAVKRALTEMNQILFTVQLAFNGRDSVDPTEVDHEAATWWMKATCGNQPYMTPDRDIPLKVYNDYPQRHSEDLLENILQCRKIVEKRDMEMLVLDQTRTDIGLGVAKVIVPGLRHCWARFAPGRLYQVPVQMGLLRESLKEQELNPVWFFL